MTLSWWQLLLVLAAPTALGFGTLRALGIGRRSDPLAAPAWAYIVGSLCSALCNLLWVAAHKPFPGTWLLPAQLAAGVALAFPTRRRATAEPADVAPTRERWILAVALALAAVLVTDKATERNAQPVTHGDEAVIWAAKAKTLFVARGLDAEFGQEARAFVRHADYPMLNPLLQLGVFEARGAIGHVDNRLPIQAFMLALLVACAAALRRYVRPALAALLVLLLLGHEIVQRLAQFASSDHMVMAGLVVATDAWLRWRTTWSVAWFRLAMIGLAVAAFAKNEGAVLGAIWLLAVGLARAARCIGSVAPMQRRELLWLLVPAGIVALGVSVNAAFGFGNDLFDPAFSARAFGDRLVTMMPERLGTVLDFTARHVLFDPGAPLVFTLFFAVLLLFPLRLLRSEVAVPALCVAGALLTFQLVFVATPYDLQWHLTTAAVRVAMQVGPLAALGLAMALAMVFAPLRASRSS